MIIFRREGERREAGLVRVRVFWMFGLGGSNWHSGVIVVMVGGAGGIVAVMRLNSLL